MKTNPLLLAASLCCLLLPYSVQAHFLQLLPQQSQVSQPNESPLQLRLVFTHPMAGGPVMSLAKPVRFGVMLHGQQQDLTASLVPYQINEATAYRAEIKIAEPGDHLFYAESAPYWEAAEGKQLIQYAKVVVDGYHAEDQWDQMIGFPVEIEPLTRPYGLWVGNQFRAVVRRDGQPVPFTLVEVEWRNDGSVQAPNPAFLTQRVKTDANGTFSYSMPRSGWWGFSAPLMGTPQANEEGEPVAVEQAAVFWVYAHPL